MTSQGDALNDSHLLPCIPEEQRGILAADPCPETNPRRNYTIVLERPHVKSLDRTLNDDGNQEATRDPNRASLPPGPTGPDK